MTITSTPAASFIQDIRLATSTDWISAPFNAARATLHQNKNAINVCAGTIAASLIPLGLTALLGLGIAGKISISNDAMDMLAIMDIVSLFLVVKVYDCLKQGQIHYDADNNNAEEGCSTERNEARFELGRISCDPLPLYTPPSQRLSNLPPYSQFEQFPDLIERTG